MDDFYARVLPETGNTAKARMPVALEIEIKRLLEICEQLDSIAAQHPAVEGSLLGIAGSIRNSISLLQVLVITRFVN